MTLTSYQSGIENAREAYKIWQIGHISAANSNKMAKQTSRSSSKGSSKNNTPRNTSGRPRPMPFKAGVTKNRTRYGNGGEFCW